MMKWVVGLFWMSLLLTAVSPTHAQAATATIIANRETLTVGDVVWITVQITHPPGYRLQLPDTIWEVFELLQMDAAEITATATTLQFSVTLWAPGDYELPPLSLSLISEEGGEITAVTPPLPLTVTSVLTPNDRQLRDIRPQATLPLPNRRWGWVWILVGGVVGGTAVWQRHKRQQPLNKEAPLVHSFRQKQLNRLDELTAQKLPQQGQIILFATAVLSILCQFLTQGYGLSAKYKTSNEISRAAAQTILPDDQQAALAIILHHIDQLRFSGSVANHQNALLVTQWVQAFIAHAPLPNEVEAGNQ